MKQLIIFLMAGLFICLQPFDVNACDIRNGSFTLKNGDIELTCEPGGTGWASRDNLKGRLYKKEKDSKEVEGIDRVVIKFYKPVEEGKKGDFQDEKGEWWVYIGEVTTKNGGYYDFDTSDDPTEGNTYYLQCDYVEGSGTA